MKNKLIPVLLVGVSLSAVNAQNPLANTAWQSVANAPMPVDVVLHFKADSAFMYVGSNGTPAEIVTYMVQGDTLTWRKVAGRTSCDTTMIGRYQFAVNGDAMKFKPISDECEKRLNVWTSEPFKKVAIPVR